MRRQGHIPKDGGAGRAANITAADFRGLGAVTETLAARFDYASSGLDDEEVQATGQ